jgi:hypothetical protein
VKKRKSLEVTHHCGKNKILDPPLAMERKSFWRFPMRGNNDGIIVLKFGGFQVCFNGVQGSLTLLLRI